MLALDRRGDRADPVLGETGVDVHADGSFGSFGRGGRWRVQARLRAGVSTGASHSSSSSASALVRVSEKPAMSRLVT